jgi:hypothetical protein
MKALLIKTALGVGLMLALGLPLRAMAGPTPGGADGDTDGVENAFDNCTAVVNGDQVDTDHDGCGNVCDLLVCDVNQDGGTTSTDFTLLKMCFGKAASCNPAADCNNDGGITSTDFTLLKMEFGKANGPSGLPASSKRPNCP